jgi:hypothetical protein
LAALSPIMLTPETKRTLMMLMVTISSTRVNPGEEQRGESAFDECTGSEEIGRRH